MGEASRSRRGSVSVTGGVAAVTHGGSGLGARLGDLERREASREFGGCWLSCNIEPAHRAGGVTGGRPPARLGDLERREASREFGAAGTVTD